MAFDGFEEIKTYHQNQPNNTFYHFLGVLGLLMNCYRLSERYEAQVFKCCQQKSLEITCKRPGPITHAIHKSPGRRRSHWQLVRLHLESLLSSLRVDKESLGPMLG